MSMISDLVDRLETESKSMGKYGTDYMATLLMQASATIITLSEKARADRPQGEVDAVEIYEKAESQLEHNEITIGEFEKIVEPLRHLFYNRPQGEWIPCSERLPSEKDYIGDVVIWCTDKSIVGVGWYYESTKSWATIDDTFPPILGEVIAWMPLPKPLKGADDE